MSSLSLFFVLSFFFLFLSQGNAAVWIDTQTWSPQYEEEYSKWMASSSVRENIFNDANSPYYGINTDCADAAYALRAIFSFEHKLPFGITNPSGSREMSASFNNRSNRFDMSGPENKRLVAMITEIGDSVGTENLTRFDTFPMAVKSIVPGSIFTYKIKARFGKFIRHTYNIKNINPVGTFDVIYSTQANRAVHGDLLRRKDRELENMPSDPWGFRRFRWPSQLNQNLDAIPQELGPSLEQYELAKEMDERKFFQYISEKIATTNETPEARLNRLFTAACQETKARIFYVNQALTHLAQTENICMDYEKFDAYSTPARDLALKGIFEKLKQSLEEARPKNASDLQIASWVNYIFTQKGSSNAGMELLTACPINYREGITIDLATVWSRLKKETLSSHPNDRVEVRWGETTKNKTKCKRWY